MLNIGYLDLLDALFAKLVIHTKNCLFVDSLHHISPTTGVTRVDKVQYLGGYLIGAPPANLESSH